MFTGLAVLSPLVRRVTAPNPSSMTGPGTNTYLVGRGEVAVIDPGPDDARHLAAVKEALAGEQVRWVLLTHTHADHAPGARSLAEETGASVLWFGGGPADTPEGSLGDGDLVRGRGFTLESVHTPGHASNHLCFLLREEQALFSGDLIMSGSTVVIAPPDGDMAAYMRSLEWVRESAPRRIYPGHGAVIDDPAAAVEEYVAHRRMRERQVLEALHAGAGTIPEMVARIYADVPESLHPAAARSVHAHLIKLRAEGKVVGTDQQSVWRVMAG